MRADNQLDGTPGHFSPPGLSALYSALYSVHCHLFRRSSQQQTATPSIVDLVVSSRPLPVSVSSCTYPSIPSPTYKHSLHNRRVHLTRDWRDKRTLCLFTIPSTYYRIPRQPNHETFCPPLRSTDPFAHVRLRPVNDTHFIVNNSQRRLHTTLPYPPSPAPCKLSQRGIGKSPSIPQGAFVISSLRHTKIDWANSLSLYIPAHGHLPSWPGQHDATKPALPSPPASQRSSPTLSWPFPRSSYQSRRSRE